MNNKWDENEQKMLLVKEQNYRFIINVGKIRFTLCYLNQKSLGGKVQSVPFVLKEGKNIPKQMSASIRIYLCKNGLQFGRDQSLFSVDSRHQVNQGDSANVIIDHKAKECDQNVWTLQHCATLDANGRHDPYFFIEMPYGDIRPRLGLLNDNPT